MIIEQKLLDIKARAKDIETKMNSGDVSGDELAKLSKEYSELNEVLPLIDKYLQDDEQKEIFKNFSKIRTSNIFCTN